MPACGRSGPGTFVSRGSCLGALRLLAVLCLLTGRTLAVEVEWQASEQISGLSLGDTVRVAATVEGAALVVWADNSVLYFSERSDGGSWSTPIAVSPTGVSILGANFDVTAGPSSDVHVIFAAGMFEGGNLRYRVQVTTRTSGGASFSAPATVSDDNGTALKVVPRIVSGSDGALHAVWGDHRGGGNRMVYHAMRPSGGSWGANVKVNDGTAATDAPALSVGRAGDAHVVWQDFRGTAAAVYYDVLPAGGSFGTDEKVDDGPTNQPAGSPAVSVGPEEEVLAVWQDKPTAGNEQIRSSVRQGSGVWGSSQRVDHELDPTIHRTDPAVEFDIAGFAHAVWHNGRGGISAARRADGSWGATRKVSSSKAEPALRPDLAIETIGNLHVVWAASLSAAGVHYAQGTNRVGNLFIRGDANGDDSVDLTDPVFTARALFQGDQAPLCDDAADSNDDGDVDVSDAVYVLLFLYAGGPSPPLPYPDPGLDPTLDNLNCLLCEPLEEVCDGVDNDCDGFTDEGFDLLSDPQNCGSCGNVCAEAPHAAVDCVLGSCRITSCDDLYYDVDGIVDNGCEAFAPAPSDAARILKAQGASIDEIGTILRDVYGLDATRTARVLGSAGCGISAVAEVLRDLFSENALSAAEILQRVFVPNPVVLGEILRDAFGQSAQTAAPILRDVTGVAPRALVPVFRDVFGQQPVAIALLLKNTFGASLQDATEALRDGGYGAVDVAEAVRLRYGLTDPADVAEALNEAGYSVLVVADAVESIYASGFPDPVPTIARILQRAGYDADDVRLAVGALYPQSSLTNLAVVRIRFEPEDPVAGQTVRVQVTFANFGTTEETPRVVCSELDSGAEVFDTSITLASGETREVTGTYQLSTTAGERRFAAQIDFANTISEYDESDDNYLEAALTSRDVPLIEFASPSILFAPEPQPPMVTNAGTDVRVEALVVHRGLRGADDTEADLRFWATTAGQSRSFLSEEDVTLAAGKVNSVPVEWTVPQVASTVLIEVELRVGADLLETVSRTFPVVQPDLALFDTATDLSFGTPVVGQPLAFQVRAHNLRSRPETIWFEAVIDEGKGGSVVLMRQLVEIEATPLDIETTWNSVTAGDHTITARLTSIYGGGAVTNEADVTNNVVTRSLTAVSDLDGDGTPDGEDDDRDGDGLANDLDPDPNALDTDGDGLPDGWVDGWAFNGYRWGPYGEQDGQVDPWEGEDLDADGVFVPGESDPRDIDSDGDLLFDGEERYLGSDPGLRDTDGDGLEDCREVTTDFCQNHLLLDPERATCCGEETETSPSLPDTDGDGLSDGAEEAGWLVAVFRPFDPQTGSAKFLYQKTARPDPLQVDTDSDGLTDLEESEAGSDPRLRDTDQDGIDDREDDNPTLVETETPTLSYRTAGKLTGVGIADVTLDVWASDNVTLGSFRLKWIQHSAITGTTVLADQTISLSGLSSYSQRFTLQGIAATSSYDVELTLKDRVANETKKTIHIPSAWQALADWIDDKLHTLGGVWEWATNLTDIVLDKIRELIDGIVRPAVEEALADVCAFEIVFDPDILAAVIGDAAPPDLGDAADLEELADLVSSYLAEEMLAGLQDDVVGALPEPLRETIDGLETVLGTVEPVLDAVDDYIGDVQLFLMDAVQRVLYAAASASGIGVLQDALESSPLAQLQSAADELLPELLAGLFGILGVPEEDVHIGETLEESGRLYRTLVALMDLMGPGTGESQAAWCRAVSDLLDSRSFLFTNIALSGVLNCIEDDPDLEPPDDLVAGISITLTNALENPNDDNEVDKETSGNQVGLEILVTWNVCEGFEVQPNVDIYYKIIVGLGRKGSQPWLGKILKHPIFQAIQTLNELPYCDPTSISQDALAKVMMRRILELQTDMNLPNALVERWSGVFLSGSSSQAEIRRKVGLGLFFGRRSAGPGMDVKVQMVEAGIPEFWCPRNWHDGSLDLSGDWSFTFDLLDKGTELSASKAVFVSE